MSFEDPFADDLRGFRSTAAGLGRANASPAPSAAGRARDAAPPLFSVPGAGLQGAAASASGRGGGTASPTSVFGSSVGTSLFAPSSASAAPVAGRRARAEAATASHASGGAAPSGNLQATTQAPAPHRSVAASPAQAPAAATLSWLDDVEVTSAPSVANSAATGTSRLPPPPPLRPGAGPTPAAVAASAADAQGAPLPSFLDFGGGSHPAAPSSTGPRPGSAAGVVAAPETAMRAAAAAAEAEAQRKSRELRDLYATLDALEAEQQRLAERLDDREVREEAELLTLQTSALVKATELEEREEELATKRAELQRQTAERLDALTRRYAEETAAQAAEVRGLDGARYAKQLQQVCERHAATEQVVRELREQAALLVTTQPYSEAGVRIALADAASTAAGLESSDGSAADSSASPALEAALLHAVALLRGYCDERLRAARDKLVDYMHENALEAAHAVRRRREAAWAEDAMRHKELFAHHLTDMMQRYVAFYKERALLKQENMTALHTELQQTAADLRRSAADRLQQLLRDVTAKMALSTRRYTESAAAASDGLQRKARAVLDGDAAVAAAQGQELESRLVTEAQARRQRHRAEQASLAEQLQRWRRCGEAIKQEAFDHLCKEAAGATSAQRARPLLDEVMALKARLEERLHPRAGGGGGRGDDVTSPIAAARTAASVARMHAEELAHVVRSSTAQAAAQQEAAETARQRCVEQRAALTQSLCTETVERLQRVRSTQHAHQARLDAMVRTWATAHRQNLAAACSLTLPTSGSTTGVTDAAYTTETYAAPRDVASTALLEALQDKLHARDATRRVALDARRVAVKECARRLGDVHATQATLHEQWGEVWSATQAQTVAQAASHDGAVEVERGLATVEAELRVVERDRRRAARQCERAAEMARRAEAEAARLEVPLPVALAALQCPPILCPTPALTVYEPRSGDALVSTPQYLVAVDANIMTKSAGGGNTFTTVHASTNAAASAAGAAAAPTMSAPASREHSTASSPPSPNASLSSASPGVLPETHLPRQGSTTAAATAATAAGASPAVQPSGPRHARTVGEASFATETQPWSSSLARAEDQLQTRARATSAASPPRDEFDTVDDDGGGAAQASLHPPRATPRHSTASVRLSAPAASARPIDSTVEGSGGRVPARARRESASWPSGIELAESPAGQPDPAGNPQHLLLPPTSASSTSGSSELQTPSALTFSMPAGATVLPSSWHRRTPSQLQQRLPRPGAAAVGDSAVSHATWSTLDEYRSSSADLPARAAAPARGGAVSAGDGGAAAQVHIRGAEAVSPVVGAAPSDTLDDSGDFMPLLSCADSPASSSTA